jgi:hypothetical protein
MDEADIEEVIALSERLSGVWKVLTGASQPKVVIAGFRSPCGNYYLE